MSVLAKKWWNNLKHARTEWKLKHNIPKPMWHNRSRCKSEVHIYSAYVKKSETLEQITWWCTIAQSKPKVRKKKKRIKIREEIKYI